MDRPLLKVELNMLTGRHGKYYPGSTEHDGHVDPGSSHAYLLDFVGQNKRVLEFGCSGGFMSRHLSEAGCTVTGVEIDSEAAADARPWCESVVIADLDFQTLADILPRNDYDVAVFGDVLEHLRDPWRVLKESRDFLAPTGFVAISIPNVAHGALRLALLKGEFEYQELGLLDDTHLRFFTLKTVQELCISSGFRIDRIERTKAPMFGEANVVPHVLREEFDPELVERIVVDPDHDTLQFVLKVSPMNDDGRYQFVVNHIFETRAELESLRRHILVPTPAAKFGGGGAAARILELETRLGIVDEELTSHRAMRARLVELENDLARTGDAQLDLVRANRALNRENRLNRARVLADAGLREALATTIERLEKTLSIERHSASGHVADVALLKSQLSTLESERDRLVDVLQLMIQEFNRRNGHDLDTLRMQIARADTAIARIHQSRAWKWKLGLARLTKRAKGIARAVMGRTLAR